MVIDDASVARVQKLLTISNVVSNFPLIIVGLGAIMLAIFVVLLIRARQQKVLLYPDFVLLINCSPFPCFVPGSMICVCNSLVYLTNNGPVHVFIMDISVQNGVKHVVFTKALYSVSLDVFLSAFPNQTPLFICFHFLFFVL